MTRKFINRERELKTLNECWDSESFEFIVIYGRRRVGKTEIIKRFIEGKRAIYFLCSERKIPYNLKKFSEKVCEFVKIPIVTFKNFQDAFDVLISKSKGKVIVAIDEFGYLVRKEPAVLSDLQEVVDEKLKGRNIMLILCGSSVSLMETQVLGYKSPLYGRATKYMKIEPLPFPTLKEWFNQSAVEDLVKIYSVTNGIPKYLEFFTGRNTEEEIIKNFFDPYSFLYNDAIVLLSEELRDYSTYIQVLEAIALGYNRVNQIAGYAFLQPKDVFFYLKVLSSLGIVKRMVPIFSPRKAKRGIYVINDNYFSFWFSFISPYQAEIESGNLEAPIENFKKQFNTFLGKTFERIVTQSLNKLLPFTPTKIGKWWHKGREIDIVAGSERTREIAFIEVKWSILDTKQFQKTVDELKEKTKYIGWYKNKRREYYGVIAKEIKEKNELKKRFLAYDLTDLITS